MKDYVSLYDFHLRTFFSSETIRKNLKSKGFIDSKGFIMYDPEHRNVMREKNTKKKKKKLISNEEIMNSIKGIDVPSNIKDKEIDAQKLAEESMAQVQEEKAVMNGEVVKVIRGIILEIILVLYLAKIMMMKRIRRNIKIKKRKRIKVKIRIRKMIMIRKKMMILHYSGIN